MDTRAWTNAFLAQRKGSHATREAGQKTIENLNKFVEGKKWKNVRPESVSPKQIRFFVEQRLKEVSPRVVQNELSHIRRCLEGAGRKLGDIREPSNSWSSTRLSLPANIPRATHKPAVSEQARSRMDELKPDVRAVIDLQDSMGLRVGEGVEAHKSFREWRSELDRSKDGVPVRLTVVHGTKGARPRDVLIHPEKIDAVRAAIERAAALVKENKEKGITGIVPKPNLKEAKKRVENGLGYRGFNGSNSSHGFRRAWAQQQMVTYRELGLTHDEAKFRVAGDLGHGRTDIIHGHYLAGGEG